MIKQLEALIVEMKVAAEKQDKYLKGGAFSIDWDEYITPKNVLALIAALEQSQREQNILIDQFAINIGKERDKRILAEKRIAELEASQLAPVAHPVMFIDGDISPADAEKLANVITEWAEEDKPSQLVVKLPRAVEICQFDHRRGLKGQDMYPRIDIVEMLRAAGITVQGDE